MRVKHFALWWAWTGVCLVLAPIWLVMRYWRGMALTGLFVADALIIHYLI